jgi:ferritin-like metal-binding protein YciE
LPVELIQHEGTTMAKIKTLEDLLTDAVKDLYFAEKKIMTALPKMAKAAESEELAAAFEKHLAETETQVERLEQVFEELDETARGKKCPAILGIIEEGQEIMKEYKGSPALDAGLLAAAQAVEHYEICRYGTVVTWAEQLGLRQVARLLKQTLNEEEKTDQALSKLALSMINRQAQAEAAE